MTGVQAGARVGQRQQQQRKAHAWRRLLQAQQQPLRCAL
jgi:hypothetical protein